MYVFVLFLFFKQKTAYEMRSSDWSSDVCSSDLYEFGVGADAAAKRRHAPGQGQDTARETDRTHQNLALGKAHIVPVAEDLGAYDFACFVGRQCVHLGAQLEERHGCAKQSGIEDRISVDDRSEEHTSELQ